MRVRIVTCSLLIPKVAAPYASIVAGPSLRAAGWVAHPVGGARARWHRISSQLSAGALRPPRMVRDLGDVDEPPVPSEGLCRSRSCITIGAGTTGEYISRISGAATSDWRRPGMWPCVPCGMEEGHASPGRDLTLVCLAALTSHVGGHHRQAAHLHAYQGAYTFRSQSEACAGWKLVVIAGANASLAITNVWMQAVPGRRARAIGLDASSDSGGGCAHPIAHGSLVAR